MREEGGNVSGLEDVSEEIEGALDEEVERGEDDDVVQEEWVSLLEMRQTAVFADTECTDDGTWQVDEEIDGDQRER